jgi:HPt (histidine-containing phosphotransfer) domain-containing protein
MRTGGHGGCQEEGDRRRYGIDGALRVEPSMPLEPHSDGSHDEEDEFFVHSARDEDEQDGLLFGSERPPPGDALDDDTLTMLHESLTEEMRESVVASFESMLPSLLADIRDAAGRGDSGAVRRAAHNLKGIAATLGAVRLSAACVAVERSGRTTDKAIDPARMQELETLALRTLAELREQLL